MLMDQPLRPAGAATGGVTVMLEACAAHCAMVERFVPRRDRLGFPPGFLASAPRSAAPTDLLRAYRGHGGAALLAANTARAGWQFVAAFPDVCPDALGRAIVDGALLATR